MFDLILYELRGEDGNIQIHKDVIQERIDKGISCPFFNITGNELKKLINIALTVNLDPRKLVKCVYKIAEENKIEPSNIVKEFSDKRFTVYSNANGTFSIKEKGIIRNPIRKNVLWHHRLETNKGLSILVDIIEAMPDYTFHIAGNWMPSICTKEIIKSVETRILSPEIENVFFYGLLEDMSDLFSMCSLSLSTSFDESFGISIAESIANGIPSVSNCAGVGKYSDKIIPYEAHYSEWVKEIRICDQSIKEAKNKSFINNNYSSDNFKQSWDNVLWS